MFDITTGIAGYIVIAIIVWIVLFIDTRKTNIYDLLERKWLGLSTLKLSAITIIAVGWLLVAFVLTVGTILNKLFEALFSKNKPTQCLPHEEVGDL
ncbi:hypothetical protein KKG29_03405 [Patescibacteria group bacterium]|nr:hypothetical protein [Patescibacteria group bacterium]MBU4000191.1 hypothetical protein [Patescibacteria group bacterium]MBU4057130.1 hypothetical protein [Patescibacteria group bacterium]MBU4369073.1 hypothetical protein [Patescibacteria group bacterium]